MNIQLKPVTAEQLPAVVELDRLCLGGLWSLEGYRREIESPNSDLLVLESEAKAEGRGQEAEGEAKAEGRGQKAEGEAIPREQIQFPLPPLHPFTHLPIHPSTHPPQSSVLGLACLWSIADEAHITILAVHPDYRRRGLGQALLLGLLRSAWRRELKWATLEVRVSNQAAIALYQQFGFQEAGRRKRYYQDNEEDALILWRSGLQHPEFPQTLKTWQQVVGDRLNQEGWTLQSKI